MAETDTNTTPSLRRLLGPWDLTALGVNQVIGGAIFLVPATLALQLGSWSWLAVGCIGLLSMAVALNFAEAGSRFDGTGGPYLYARSAFGRFVSFEVGWMTWFTRVSSWATVVNGFADALGFYWPGIRSGVSRVTLISSVVLVIMGLNIRGIKQSSFAINLLTVGKLVPLTIFMLAGFAHFSFGRLAPGAFPSLQQLPAAALLLIFTFGGYEVIPVPAGEARDPRRDVPFAMITAIIVVTIVFMLVQMVSLATFPDLAWSKTPLADASLLLLGSWGALMMTAGTSVSMAGNNVGAALSGSRSLFALAEQHDVPRIFAHINQRFRTPDAAIVFTCLATLGVALSGSFSSLAPVSALARLVIYTSTCAAVLALRRKSRAPFTIPGGPVVPVVALAVCVAILLGATSAQLQAGGKALAAGALLYLIARLTRK